VLGLVMLTAGRYRPATPPCYAC